MTDKEMLDRMMLAYKNYPYPSIDIERFIAWVYKQYGVVLPENRNK